MAARSIVSNSLAGGLRVVALLSLRLSVPPSELECPLMEQARSNHCSNWSLLWSFQSRRIFKDKATMKHYLLSQAWCDLDLVASSIIDESLKHTFIPFLSSHVLRIRFLFFFFLLNSTVKDPTTARRLKADAGADTAALLMLLCLYEVCVCKMRGSESGQADGWIGNEEMNIQYFTRQGWWERRRGSEQKNTPF